jgi:hypothetical protein
MGDAILIFGNASNSCRSWRSGAFQTQTAELRIARGKIPHDIPARMQWTAPIRFEEVNGNRTGDLQPRGQGSGFAWTSGIRKG